MVTYNVSTGTPVILDHQERKIVSKNIQKAADRHAINILMWNVLPDHVHIILSAENKTSLNELVRKIKGFTSYQLKKSLGWYSGEPIWAQKFHHTLIEHPQTLINIINYTWDNHLKHQDKWDISRYRHR